MNYEHGNINILCGISTRAKYRDDVDELTILERYF